MHSEKSMTMTLWHGMYRDSHCYQHLSKRDYRSNRSEAHWQSLNHWFLSEKSSSRQSAPGICALNSVVSLRMIMVLSEKYAGTIVFMARLLPFSMENTKCGLLNDTARYGPLVSFESNQ